MQPLTNAKSREICGRCGEDKSASSFFFATVTNLHPRNVCNACLRQFELLSTEFRSNNNQETFLASVIFPDIRMDFSQAYKLAQKISSHWVCLKSVQRNKDIVVDPRYPNPWQADYEFASLKEFASWLKQEQHSGVSPDSQARVKAIINNGGSLKDLMGEPSFKKASKPGPIF